MRPLLKGHAMLTAINIIGALVIAYLIFAEIRDTRADNAEARNKQTSDN